MKGYRVDEHLILYRKDSNRGCLKEDPVTESLSESLLGWIYLNHGLFVCSVYSKRVELA